MIELFGLEDGFVQINSSVPYDFITADEDETEMTDSHQFKVSIDEAVELRVTDEHGNGVVVYMRQDVFNRSDGVWCMMVEPVVNTTVFNMPMNMEVINDYSVVIKIESDISPVLSVLSGDEL